MKVTSNQTSNLDGSARTSPQEQAGQAKNINSLAPGEKFKATVTDIQQNQVTLKLYGGDTLTAKSLILPDARIGEDSIFMVKENFKGQILLEMVKPDDNSFQSNIAKEALLNAEMYVNGENMDLAKLLMKNNLPVDANTLQKAAFFKYSDSSLSLDKLLFLLKEELPATEKSITMLNGIMDNTLKIKDSLESLVADILKISDVDAKKDIIRIALGLTGSEGAIETPERRRLERLIDLALDEKNPIVRDKTDNYNNTKSHMRELTDEISRKFFPELKSTDSSKELKNFYGQLDDITSKIAEQIKDTDSFASLVERITEVKDSMRFMSQIDKFKEYIQIPFSLDGTRNQGDIFIFKDSKGSKNYRENASVLIALDNAAIGRVEIFVSKRFNDLTMNFKAENDSTVKLISENVNGLIYGLEQKGYTISGCNTARLKEPSRLTDLPEPEESAKKIPKRYSFDMRV